MLIELLHVGAFGVGGIGGQMKDYLLWEGEWNLLCLFGYETIITMLMPITLQRHAYSS